MLNVYLLGVTKGVNERIRVLYCLSFRKDGLCRFVKWLYNGECLGRDRLEGKSN